MSESTASLASLSFVRPRTRRPLVAWLVSHTRRGRLRRYANAMGWYLTTEGVLVGDVDGIAIRAYEDRKHVAVVELVAPGVLPRLEIRPRALTASAQIGDGMREVHTGDAHFDAVYVLRAADPWLARAVVDSSVRRSLAAAPVMTVVTVGERLVSRGGALDPLDLLARGTALRSLLQAVPWEAYPDRRTIPSQDAVQEVVRARQMVPVEPLPSVGRRA